MGREETYLNTIKAICDKPTVNIIFNGKRLKAFPLRSGRQECPVSTCIKCSIESPSQSNKARQRNKMYPNWKGQSKTVAICRWHDIIYRKP